jgi:hypothetical protein
MPLKLTGMPASITGSWCTGTPMRRRGNNLRVLTLAPIAICQDVDPLPCLRGP